MDKKIKIGVIGNGIIGEQHINNYRKISGCEVVAICDINEERLNYIGDTYGIQRRFTHIGKLLQEKDIDAVDVCLHNNMHAPVSIAAMEAGKDVYCEKPMAGIITASAPAAMAFVISPLYFMPPSAITGIPCLAAAEAMSYIAVIWGTPIPATTRVVQIEPGPIPTLTASAPASIKNSAASAVAIFPAITCAEGKWDFKSLTEL